MPIAQKVFSGESEEAVSRLLARSDASLAHAAEEDKGPSVRPGGTTPGTNANVVRSVVIQCECEGPIEVQLMHCVQLCGGGAVRITGQGPTWVTICKVSHDSEPKGPD